MQNNSTLHFIRHQISHTLNSYNDNIVKDNVVKEILYNLHNLKIQYESNVFTIYIPSDVFQFSFFGKCPLDAFTEEYSYLNGTNAWFTTWINNEFPCKKNMVYITDSFGLYDNDIHIKFYV